MTHTQTDASAHRDEIPELTPRSSAALNDEVLQAPVRNPLTGYALAAGLVLLVAFLLRILRLDAYMLGEIEGGWAYDGWSIFHGRPVPGAGGLPDVAPVFQLAIAISFALFGVTDATARVASALLGFGIVALVFALRPFVSRSHLIAMALLAAISPTLVFASRTVDPAIAAAFLTFLTLIALLRAGAAETRVTQAGWSLGVGLGVAGIIGTGIDGVTALLSLGVGVFLASVTDASGRRERPRGPARSGITAIATSPTNVSILLAGLVVALVILFSRMLTDFTALTGLVATFTDWGRFMMSRASSLSTSFYFWALLLYEMLAVVFALIAAVSRRPEPTVHAARRQAINPMLFAGWFFSALVLHSFASGRETSHAVLIALPLVLLGGLGLGDVLARLDASGFWRSQSWGMPLMVLGLTLGLVATVAVVTRAMDRDVVPPSGLPGWLVVLMLAALALVTFGAIGALPASGGDDRHLRIADPLLIMVAAALVLFGVISTAGLAFQRADTGTELLARHLPSQDAAALVERVHQVSRDLSVENRSNIDPTGSYGLYIGISPDMRWPLAWYFRDYPFVRVTPPAGWNENTDIAFATSADGMATYGLTPQQNEWIIRPPQAHVDLNAGDILGRVFEPESWSSAIRYLVGREIENPQEPSHVTVGYSNRVNNQLNPNFGPFDLFDPEYPGPGSGQGQLSQPAGIGVSPDGEIIYILNAGNQRIDRFQRDGTFIGVWDGAVDTALGLSWNVNQGGTGLTVAQDGLIYIADTWNHTVVVVDQNGTVVRQLGQRGQLTDITDEGISLDSPGLFFGPRGVAVTNERIFVTDTGNERVQVFSRDGTFLTAFGGFGSDPGQLIEPTGIVIGPDGNIWVADSGNARIQVFSIEGEHLREIPVPAWEGQLGIDRLNDLSFDERGILYLTTPMLGTLSAFDGEQVVEIPNAPQTRAGGIAVEPDGTILMTDVVTGVVHRIEPDLPEGFGAPGEPIASPVASPGASPVASPVATPVG